MIACRADLDAYLAHPDIGCLICERRFSTLGRHLRLAHSITAAEYRANYGIPAGAPLAGRLYREERARIMRQMIATGIVTQDHLPRATAAAAGSDRTQRVEWEREEQAERAAVIPHQILPPGTRSVTGRDMDNARDYQRRRRAGIKKGG